MYKKLSRSGYYVGLTLHVVYQVFFFYSKYMGVVLDIKLVEQQSLKSKSFLRKYQIELFSQTLKLAIVW